MVKNLKEINVIDFITLSKPFARIIVFIVVLLILLVIPVNFLESLPSFSICHYVFGKYCYSFGITRGVSSLLKCDLNRAINYNPLSIIVLIVIITIIVIDFIRIKRNFKN